MFLPLLQQQMAIKEQSAMPAPQAKTESMAIAKSNKQGLSMTEQYARVRVNE